MSKYYPPQIEGTLPAFYGKELRIPYTMNQTVSINLIKKWQLELKLYRIISQCMQEKPL